MKGVVEPQSHTHHDLDGLCPALSHGLLGPVGLSCVPNHFPSGTGLSCAACTVVQTQNLGTGWLLSDDPRTLCSWAVLGV